MEFKVIEIKQGILSANDREAEGLRRELREKKTFLLNLMSSPGSGKTSTLMQTIPLLSPTLLIGVMEADIDSDVDARTVSATGAQVIQLHTGGMCHLDAEMTRQGLNELDLDALDLVILENVGNLVCPAEFDTGSVKNAVVLSVPEGDDKPLKYPLMFTVADVLLVNKIGAAACFDFDLEVFTQRVHTLRPGIPIFPISAKTGEGVEAWCNWLREQVRQWQET